MVRKQLTLLALVILLLPLGLAQADSTDNRQHCGDLSDADCQIILDNIAVMDEVFSLAFLMDMALDVSGDGAGENLQLAGQAGRAPLSVDEQSAREIIAKSEGMSAADANALLETLLTGMTGEIWLDLAGAADDEDFEMELQLRMKEGVVLIGAGAMEALSGQEMGGLEWFGIDMTAGLEDLLSEFVAADEMDAAMAGSAEPEAAVAAATAIIRLPDSEVNGIAVAVFETTIDLEEILSTLTFADLAAALPEGEDPQVGMDLIQHIAVNAFSSRQYIGLDDRFSYGMDLAFDMEIAGEFYGTPGSSMAVVFDMSIETSDFNVPVHVEIPEDAFVFPLSMLTQMGNLIWRLKRRASRKSQARPSASRLRREERRGWDSNPRYPRRVQLFSRQSRSSTLAPLPSEQEVYTARAIREHRLGHRQCIRVGGISSNADDLVGATDGLCPRAPVSRPTSILFVPVGRSAGSPLPDYFNGIGFITWPSPRVGLLLAFRPQLAEKGAEQFRRFRGVEAAFHLHMMVEPMVPRQICNAAGRRPLWGRARRRPGAAGGPAP